MARFWREPKDSLDWTADVEPAVFFETCRDDVRCRPLKPLQIFRAIRRQLPSSSDAGPDAADSMRWKAVLRFDVEAVTSFHQFTPSQGFGTTAENHQ